MDRGGVAACRKIPADIITVRHCLAPQCGPAPTTHAEWNAPAASNPPPLQKKCVNSLNTKNSKYVHGG